MHSTRSSRWVIGRIWGYSRSRHSWRWRATRKEFKKLLRGCVSVIRPRFSGGELMRDARRTKNSRLQRNGNASRSSLIFSARKCPETLPAWALAEWALPAVPRPRAPRNSPPTTPLPSRRRILTTPTKPRRKKPFHRHLRARGCSSAASRKRQTCLSGSVENLGPMPKSVCL